MPLSISFHHFATATTTASSDVVVVDICLFFRIHFMRQSSPRELLSTKTHFTSVVIPFKLQLRFAYFTAVTTTFCWKENEEPWEKKKKWKCQKTELKENKTHILSASASFKKNSVRLIIIIICITNVQRKDAHKRNKGKLKRKKNQHVHILLPRVFLRSCCFVNHQNSWFHLCVGGCMLMPLNCASS